MRVACSIPFHSSIYLMSGITFGWARKRIEMPKAQMMKRKGSKLPKGKARRTSKKKTERDAKHPKASPPTVTINVEKGKKRKRASAKVGYTGTSRVIRGGRKISRMDPYRVMQKIERGQNFIGFNAIYPGGATHPAFVTFRTLCSALIRFLAKQAKIDFGDWNDGLALPFVPLSKWQIFFYYRGEGDALINTDTFRETVDANAAGTWAALVDILATKLISVLDDPGKRLYLFGVCPSDLQTTTQSFIATQAYHATDLYVSIKGESSIQIQNRTLADGAGDTADASNIFNNPLRGKYYTFRSGRPLLRNVGAAVGAQRTQFDYASIHGAIATQDRFAATVNSSDFPETIANSLRKPPPGNAFSNCVTSKYCTVEPGGILRAKVEKTVTKSLSQWVDAFMPKLRALGAPTLNEFAQRDPIDWRMGVSHCFGLEKMVDTQAATTPELQIGLEHNLFQVGRVTYKPKNSVLPAISIVT